MSRVAGYVRRHHIALLALFVALGGTSYAAVKSIVGRDGVIHGCYARKTGALRVVKPSARCHRGESKIAWNNDGRPGLRGIAGPEGPRGPAGAAAPPAAAAAHVSLGQSTLTGSTPVAADLASPGGSGKLVTTFPSRLVMHATADFSKPSGQGNETVSCLIRLDSGSGFQFAGTAGDVTLPDVGAGVAFAHSSPAASADVPAGTYNVQLRCARDVDDSDAGTTARLLGADLNVVAVARPEG